MPLGMGCSGTATWAYRNSPHESTREKPSFLLFGLDLRSPTEVALLPSSSVDPADISDYREDVTFLGMRAGCHQHSGCSEVLQEVLHPLEIGQIPTGRKWLSA